MSAQFFQRSVPAANTHIRSDNIVCDNVVQAKTVTMTNYRIRNGAVLTQLLNATQPVDAGLKDAVIINTQYWYNVTPTTNASFLITNFNCSGSQTIVNCSIQRYGGTTGIPVLTGLCLDGNQYKVTISNNHNSANINGTLRISAEITYLG